MKRPRSTAWVGYHYGLQQVKTITFSKTGCWNEVYRLVRGRYPYHPFQNPYAFQHRQRDIQALREDGWRVERVYISRGLTPCRLEPSTIWVGLREGHQKDHTVAPTAVKCWKKAIRFEDHHSHFYPKRSWYGHGKPPYPASKDSLKRHFGWTVERAHVLPYCEHTELQP